MKTLYLDCGMGASGDMLLGALLELLDEPQAFLDRMNALGLKDVRVTAQPCVKCGVVGTHVSVAVGGHEEQSLDVPEHLHAHDAHAPEHSLQHDAHAHTEHGGGHGATLLDVERLVRGLALPERVKIDACAVYRRLAEAEARVHGGCVAQTHFHEVGSMDAVADVVGCCLLIDWLAPEQILASPVHVGSGQVRCAHGILPVPAPATAELLRHVPIYGGAVRGELCTPTGAALLTHFVAHFGALPVLRVERIGYGMGSKDFPAANCVRALLGQTESDGTNGASRADGTHDISQADGAHDAVVELCCNLDDMTPEAVGYACERLREAGALEVYTVAIGMKKNRPGVLLTCLCDAARREAVQRALFLHTTTLGVRERDCRRTVLHRESRTVETPDGTVRIKRAEGMGVVREKPEYDDVAQIAMRTGEPFAAVFARVLVDAHSEGKE